MKMRVYFVDEYDSSRFNGIGTFRDVLVPLLGANDDIELSVISLNGAVDNLEINRRDFGVEYTLPPIARGNWRDCGELIWPLLSQYIVDDRANVFIFNHSPASRFIGSMKTAFPQSKSVFVIHDQGWCADLFGDSRLLKAVISGCPPTWADEKLCKDIVSYFREEQKIYEAVDKVVCLSDSTENILRRIYGVPHEKLEKIYNGYPAERGTAQTRSRARRHLGLRDDDEVLIFVARPAPHKGIIPMLKAALRLRRSHPRLRVVLSGAAGGFTKYWELAKKIAPNVILTGHLSPKELSRWYAAADVGVLSSYTEQCSYAALEMMNAGIAIVASDGNGLCDMFTDGRDAMVAHIGSVRAVGAYSRRLAARIDRALSMSAPERLGLASAAKKLAKERYAASVMAGRYVALLSRLAG